MTALTVAAIALTLTLRAQEEPQASYEYAIVKWDGPDRIYYNIPGRFELVHLEKAGVEIPRTAQSEEFCLAYAANKMAREGWEPIGLDSRRILFRKATR